jgi:hypothetical protein
LSVVKLRLGWEKYLFFCGKSEEICQTEGSRAWANVDALRLSLNAIAVRIHNCRKALLSLHHLGKGRR